MLEEKVKSPVEVLFILSKAKGVEKRLSVNSLPDGVVGLFHMDDDNLYEIVVRPAEYGKYQGLYKKLLK